MSDAPHSVRGVRAVIQPNLSPRLIKSAMFSVVVVLIALLLSPGFQLPVLLTKAALVLAAGVGAFFFDQEAFPYARPDGYLHRDWRKGTHEPENDVDYPVVIGYRWVFAAAMLRRAMIMGCAMLAVAMGA